MVKEIDRREHQILEGVLIKKKKKKVKDFS